MRREGGSYRYDFPLGTGRGWANPIANTAVYVGAEDGLHLEVEAPGKARLNARPDRGLALRAISFNAGAAGGRQVYSAIYSRQQPERDLIVRVFDRGRSEWVQDARGRQGRIIGWYAGFLLIGAAAWVVAVALTLSPKVGGSRQVLWRVAATSWLLAGIPVLAMLVAIAVLWLLVIAGSEGTAEAIILALGISAFLAMAAAPVMRFYDRHVLTQQAGWPWATVALSALIYFVVRHTMEWGWPWVAAALAALTYFIVRHVMKRSGWPTPPASPLALRPPGLE
jgi:hypothetical protein